MMNDWLVLPVVVPLIAAAAILVLPRAASVIGIGSCVTALAAGITLACWVVMSGSLELAIGGWAPGLGVALRMDALSALLVVMTNTIGLVVSIYAVRYFNGAVRKSYWPTWMLMLAALQALYLSGDLFNLYVTLELVGLSAVALTILNKKPEALRAGMRYLMAGLVGSLLFLAGVALTYARYGSLDLYVLAEAFDAEVAAWTAISLMSAGLMVKSALFPLHFWLPQAHGNAPAPVSAALSALVIKAGIYLLYRLWFEWSGAMTFDTAAELIGLLGAAGVLFGSWQALRSVRLKHMAAYSTVAQVGYLFLFFPILAELPEGETHSAVYAALLAFMVSHAFAKSAFFLAAGVVQDKLGHDRIDDLNGLAERLPLTAFTLALAVVALIGLPPSGTFIAKWVLLSASIETGAIWWVGTVLVGTLLSAGYGLRLLGIAFARLPPAAAHSGGEGGAGWAMGLAFVSTFVLGLGATELWSLLTPTPQVIGA